MPTLVTCQDVPDAKHLRESHRKAHLDYVKNIINQIYIAGPICQSDSAIEDREPDGGIIIYATDNIAEARQLFANDPYALAGVYQSFQFSRFEPAAGTLLRGVP